MNLKWNRIPLLVVFSLVITFTSFVVAQDSANVSCLGNYYHNWIGTIQDIHWMSNNRVYMALGNGGLRIVDVTNPSQPVEVGFNSNLGFAKALDVVGNYAYVVQRDVGLWILNVTTPSNPIVTSFIAIPGHANNVTVTSAGYAYVSAGDSGLVVINVSAPANPQRTWLLDTPGWTSDVKIRDTVAFVADSANFLILAMTNPAHPVNDGVMSTPAQKFDLVGNYLYVPNDNGLSIFNVTSAHPPRPAGRILRPATGGWSNIKVVNNLALMTNSAGLTIANVASPTAPTISYLYTAPTNCGAVDGNANMVYLSSNGLRITDISTPTSPQTHTTFNLGGIDRDVSISGNYAYVSNRQGGLVIFDITNPNSPFVVGRTNISTDALQTVVYSNRAYVSRGTGQIDIINVTNPAVPTYVMNYVENRPITDMVVTGSTMWAAIGNGLRVLDLSDPDSPSYAGAYRLTTSSGSAVDVVGTTVYLGLANGQVHILNGTNQMSPSLLGSYQGAASSILDLKANGNTLYVLNSSTSIRVLNVTNPAAPSLLGSFDSLSGATSFAITGNALLVAESNRGLRVINVTNPAQMRTIGYYRTPGSAMGLTVNRYVYVADSTNLGIYDVSTALEVDEETGSILPTSVSILKSYPNPFNNSTMISFSIPKSEYCRIEVVDECGKQISTLWNGPATAGVHQARWSPEAVASGNYFVRLSIGGKVRSTSRITYIK